MLRLNERTPRPNPHINFITGLPGAKQDDAVDILKAVAAQFKPIMKDHGFRVNSFEEYEWNRVFAGRNWNAGETIELVLRNRSGSWYTLSTLNAVMCHELAHCAHMNHGPAFQKLNMQLRKEVYALQRKGYFGDGQWSNGRRAVGDDSIVDGQALSNPTLPEYICGGAAKESKKRAPRKRRRKKEPSIHFEGQRADGTTGRRTTRRVANSKKERDARAQLYQAKLQSMKERWAQSTGQSTDAKKTEKTKSEQQSKEDDKTVIVLDSSSSEEEKNNDEEEDSDDDEEVEAEPLPPETDQEREAFLADLDPEELAWLKQEKQT